MEIHKNRFTYVYLTIFSIGMGYILLSGILNIGITTPYPFIWYGRIIMIIGILWLGTNAVTFLLRRFDLQLSVPKNNIIIESIFIIAVLAVGAGLRFWVIQNLPIAPISDYQKYYQIATLLSQGNLIKDGVGLCEYISKFPHVIGYPYILSKIFQIFDVSVSIGLYFNLVASIISIFLVYQIARLICGKVGGWIALVLMTFWPSQILYINHLASEPVFTCLVLFSLWLAVYSFNYPLKKGKVLVCLLLNIALGLSLALGGAVRPMSKILLIAIIICIISYKTKLNENIDHVGLLMKGMSKGWSRAVVILLSYILCSQFISGAIAKTINRDLPGSSVSYGYNLLVGVNIDSIGAWNEQDAKLFMDKFLETDSAEEAHRAVRSVAFKRIAKNPIGIVWLTLEKYTLLWKDDDYASSWNLLSMNQQNNLIQGSRTLIIGLIPWNNIYYLLCIFFSFLAGITLWYRKNVGPEHILILFFIGTAMLHMILESQNRYHYDIIPVFAILAASGILEFFQHKKPN